MLSMGEVLQGGFDPAGGGVDGFENGVGEQVGGGEEGAAAGAGGGIYVKRSRGQVQQAFNWPD